ncbi:MAG: hypothetical protein HYS26_00075 [Candidatus Kaiserbacteria bacterium]|nr:MAG: hypothetical protein HYS26_00075 [Candidatus Kaiserbacteria bacterium]
MAEILDERTRIQPFGRNVSAERAYRRAERIVAALHLITNHIPSDEPARTALRREAVQLLENVLQLRDELRSRESHPFKRTISSTRELVSLVRILAVSGYISQQNTSILSEALDELSNFLFAAQRSTLSESVVLKREELLSESLTDKDATRPRGIAIKDTPRRSVSVRAASSGTRSEGVLAILRSRGELGIKDIASNLPEYSEKTIQRELAALIALGRVKRTGDKRWSRYSLVQ